MLKIKYVPILLILISTALYSQGIVVLQLKQPPPFGFKLEKMWQVTLNNSTKQTYSVYLRGIATENSEGFIADAVTGTFTLPPGVKVVTASDIKPIKINETNPRYEDVVKNVGTVPNGSYEICVSVMNAETNSELANDCILTEVINLSQVELLSPEDNHSTAYGYEGDANIENKGGSETTGPLAGISAPQISQTKSLMQFSWLPPSPVTSGQRVTYRFKLVQMYGMQSPYDAMQSNPLFYKADNLNSTIYQYPAAGRTLSGGSYAWQVEAFVNGTLMSSSEIRSFNIGNGYLAQDNERQLKFMKKYWALNTGDHNSTASQTQLKKQPLMFTFDSRLYGETANRSGTGSDKMPQYGYWELNPALSIYGLPFSAPLLFSTENSASRQNINTLSLMLDASTIKDFILEKIEREKQRILDKTNKELSNLSDKQISKLETDAKTKVASRLNSLLKVISSFRSFGIGTNYPDYTPLTVRGVPLTGVNIELNPGLLYIAAGGFKNQKPIDNHTFRRDIYTGRLGIGQKDASHFYLTGMYAKDDESSIVLDASNQTLTPKANYLFGIEGRLDLFRKKLSLEGEVSGAMLTRDTRDADLENKAIPDWVKNMIHPKISSSVDYSYTVKGIFNNERSATKITAGVRMLGPGYTSLGIPNLSTDKLEVKSKIEQKLSNKQVSLTGEILWYRNNLIDWKRYTTSVTRFSLTANLRFKNLPSVNIVVAPTFMKNNSTQAADKLDNKIIVSSVFTGYGYRKGNVNLYSSLSYFMNSSSNLDSIITENASVHNLVFSQSLNFVFPLSISGSFGMSFAKYPGDHSRILSGDISASYTALDLLTYMIGYNTAYEKDKNKKNMFYIAASLGYKQFINLEVRGEKNLYHDWINTTNNYDEFILKGIVTTRF